MCGKNKIIDEDLRVVILSKVKLSIFFIHCYHFIECTCSPHSRTKAIKVEGILLAHASTRRCFFSTESVVLAFGLLFFIRISYILVANK